MWKFLHNILQNPKRYLKRRITVFLTTYMHVCCCYRMMFCDRVGVTPSHINTLSKAIISVFLFLFIIMSVIFIIVHYLVHWLSWQVVTSHNALFCNSQTQSVKDGMSDFDWVFLEYPLKSCVVNMLSWESTKHECYPSRN